MLITSSEKMTVNTIYHPHDILNSRRMPLLRLSPRKTRLPCFFQTFLLEHCFQIPHSRYNSLSFLCSLKLLKLGTCCSLTVQGASSPVVFAWLASLLLEVVTCCFFLSSQLELGTPSLCSFLSLCRPL